MSLMKRELLTDRIRKFRDVGVYFFGGFVFGLNAFVLQLFYKYRSDFFDFSVDYTRSIELGFVIIKVLIIVGIIVINIKSFIGIIRTWKKNVDYEEEEISEVAEEGYKRVNNLSKALLYWRINGARKWLDKYHEEIYKVEKKIGRVRGNETKELIRCKEELIKGILMWTDDFQITEIEIDKKTGRKTATNQPVTEEFLNTLSLSELYEDYMVKCIESAERFINGTSEVERMEYV